MIYTGIPSTPPVYNIEGMIRHMFHGNRAMYLRNVERARRALERPEQ